MNGALAVLVGIEVWAIAIAAIVGCFLVLVYLQIVNLYLMALVSGARVPAFKLVILRLRRAPLRSLVMPYIILRKANISIQFDEVVAHAKGGGRTEIAARTMIDAPRFGGALSWDQITAADIAEQREEVAASARKPQAVAGTLVGSKGVALSPVLAIIRGEVDVRGRRYRARVMDSPVGSGEEVRVVEVRPSGTLVVAGIE